MQRSLHTTEALIHAMQARYKLNCIPRLYFLYSFAFLFVLHSHFFYGASLYSQVWPII